MLERIQKENDIKNLSGEELEILAEEIRQFLVEKVSRTGGIWPPTWVWWS